MRHVLYFTADWCNPCARTKPIVEEINADSPIKFKMIDSDQETELVRNFDIKSIPTFILIEDKKEIARLTGGAKTKEQLLDFINQ